MSKYKGYFIDLDGTMYAGSKRIPAAKRFIERLQANSIDFLFVTNNTTKMPIDVVKNLSENHDIHVSEGNVYTAGLATADYVSNDAETNKVDKTVYVVGEKGLITALQQKGFTITDDHPSYVVVGLDNKATYDQLSTAVLLVRDGARFIGTNPDSNIPTEKGMQPGAGSLIKLVEYATQKEPVLIGKPKTIIMKNALNKIGLQKKDVVMVGDNYFTDISAGINFDMDTLLVYTGLSTKEQVSEQSIKPTHEVDSLDDWTV
ncbi:TIGR01457 family HAD-type hydrolase [Apilactobacillus bombintestini]|uniref:TIGR01457 family HAD-type hydrolase n=1 Tax=Apilactobacillus bombintestini TaxID=2419772 RepID=A0A387AS08_9LACO|nr:TIGR01457 family HAD-type hydrolase [Apilactobacillus bombintestini]AYF92727.1 TIGR01457 family HAD-type hydrolase [Apilactobacillus bombintestini]